ncbi:hypothetical protein PHET_03383 [Paragonimus heterotremus]|uniref:Uncharacterized protein n=1 Tax=Paragonimus heterotremus TaxID=100268 RepID=A0A8J4WRV3_9TREM|nr:hypothetical protein PHET_03383 [Paragonimus heterotremus]
MNNALEGVKPSSVANYVDANWLQQILWVAMNLTLPSDHNHQTSVNLTDPTLFGCISFDFAPSMYPDEPSVARHVFIRVVNISLVILNTLDEPKLELWNSSTENAQQFTDWLNSRLPQTHTFCTRNVQKFEHADTVTTSSGIYSLIVPDASSQPETSAFYARRIQTFLAILFCSILIVCLLTALILRIRSFVKRRLASRKSHRLDRDSAARVHFAYDVGDTENLMKPPVPSVTFGSNVYPVDYTLNALMRNGHVPRRYGQYVNTMPWAQRRLTTALTYANDPLNRFDQPPKTYLEAAMIHPTETLAPSNVPKPRRSKTRFIIPTNNMNDPRSLQCSDSRHRARFNSI